jgi:hypothetical protein
LYKQIEENEENKTTDINETSSFIW